jgi:hypothetical protein
LAVMPRRIRQLKRPRPLQRPRRPLRLKVKIGVRWCATEERKRRRGALYWTKVRVRTAEEIAQGFVLRAVLKSYIAQ